MDIGHNGYAPGNPVVANRPQTIARRFQARYTTLMAKKTTKKAKAPKAAPKKPVITQKLLIMVTAVVAILVIFIGWLTFTQHTYRNFSGTVTRVNLEGSAVDAPVYYQVRVSEKNIQDVYLNVSPTPQHPLGTPLPQVKVGDTVTVHAKKGPKGTSLVGAENTYIRRQE